MLYTALLAFHSVWRWVVLGAVAARFGRAVAARGTPYAPLDRKLGLAAIIALDLQLIAGLGLYGVSPAVSKATSDVGAAMKDPYLRFWLVEHGPMLIVAAIAAHIGNVWVRKAVADAGRHKAAAIAFGIVLVLILVAMPWPFRPVVGRPWLPGL